MQGPTAIAVDLHLHRCQSLGTQATCHTLGSGRVAKRSDLQVDTAGRSLELTIVDRSGAGV